MTGVFLAGLAIGAIAGGAFAFLALALVGIARVPNPYQDIPDRLTDGDCFPQPVFNESTILNFAPLHDRINTRG